MAAPRWKQLEIRKEKGLFWRKSVFFKEKRTILKKEEEKIIKDRRKYAKKKKKKNIARLKKVVSWYYYYRFLPYYYYYSFKKRFWKKSKLWCHYQPILCGVILNLTRKNKLKILWSILNSVHLISFFVVWNDYLLNKFRGIYISTLFSKFRCGVDFPFYRKVGKKKKGNETTIRYVMRK